MYILYINFAIIQVFWFTKGLCSNSSAGLPWHTSTNLQLPSTKILILFFGKSIFISSKRIGITSSLHMLRCIWLYVYHNDTFSKYSYYMHMYVKKTLSMLKCYNNKNIKEIQQTMTNCMSWMISLSYITPV